MNRVLPLAGLGGTTGSEGGHETRRHGVRGAFPMAAALLAAATLALAGCGGGSSTTEPPTQPPARPPVQPPAHQVALPEGHDLSAWLTANPGGTVSVPAGDHRDVGGVRFSCPAGGAACAVMVTLEDGTVSATSTDGMATAVVAPPPMHAVGLPAMHELSAWLTANPDGTVSVPAGGHRDVGGVRFTCPEGDADCTVMVMLEDGTVSATSTDGMATASLVPPPPQPPQQPQPAPQQPSTGGGGGGGGGQPPAQPPAQPPPQTPSDRSGIGWLHGLHSTDAMPRIPDTEGRAYGIQETESKVVGNVRFSCSGSEHCEVQILRIGDHYNISYNKGDVTPSPHFDPEKMYPGIDVGWRTGNSTLLDTNSGASVYEYGDNVLIGGPLASDELLFTDRGWDYILQEDTNTRIAPNYGWRGKRYVLNLGRYNYGASHTHAGQTLEAIVYSNADGPSDRSYLTYGRWLRIDRDGTWAAGESFKDSFAASRTLGLGQLRGKVTFRGGATGYYALTGDSAGWFTARATFQADLGDALSISGTIDRFVDQDGQQRDWSVELQESSFHGVTGGDGRGGDSRVREQPTVWTINGTPADPDRKWFGIPFENGKAILGNFEAAHGTKGRMVGAFGAER